MEIPWSRPRKEAIAWKKRGFLLFWAQAPNYLVQKCWSLLAYLYFKVQNIDQPNNLSNHSGLSKLCQRAYVVAKCTYIHSMYSVYVALLQIPTLPHDIVKRPDKYFVSWLSNFEAPKFVVLRTGAPILVAPTRNCLSLLPALCLNWAPYWEPLVNGAPYYLVVPFWTSTLVTSDLLYRSQRKLI